MTELILGVDIERLVADFLRAQPEVVALVGDDIFTALPTNPPFPSVRLTRIGGAPLLTNLTWIDRPLVQFDVWGGPKNQAWQIAATAQAALDSRVVGVHPEGVVTNVSFTGLRYLPDASYATAKPRYLFTATFTTHPGLGGS